MHKPTAEGYTICFVVKLFWVKLIKIIKLLIFQNFSMKRSYTVYAETAVNINMCHMHTLIFVNDIYR